MSYSNGLLPDQSYQTVNKYVQKGLPGVGFKLTVTGDYDMQNKKLVNMKEGTNLSDAITKNQLDTINQKTVLLDGSRPSYVVNNKAVIYSNTGAVHAQSLYLKDNPDNVGNSDEIRILTEHQSYDNVHLHIPDIHNYDGYGGRPKSEIMVTSVDQTITGRRIFRNYCSVPAPINNDHISSKGYVDNENIKQNNFLDTKFVKKAGDQMTGDLILPHHNYPIPGNTNKVINYESQREIFLSRQESFPMLADINMNNNFIQNIATPTSSHQATNKGYCDYNFLNRQKGGVLMGPLSMNRNDLTGIPDTPKFGYSAVNKNYVDAKIPSVDTTPFVKLDGSRTMTGNLDMDSHKITNLNLPTNDNDASNKQYIDEKLLKSHLLSSEVVNAFKYLSEVDESATISDIYIHGVVDYNGSPHKNKKAYDIDMVYSLGVQNYTSKLGINLYPLDVTGKYTIIMEYYFSPDNTNINIIAEVTKTTTIKKQTTFDETNYKKYLVQFDFPSKANPPHFLYFTISGTGTTSTNPEGYLVFYGVKGWDDAVPSEIYDHALETGLFEYDNGNMKMYNDIDMNNHNIINSNQITSLTDFMNYFILFKNFMKNKTYIDTFSNFYDLKEPSTFILDGPAISGIQPNMSINSSGSSHITVSGFDPIKGLQFNSSTKIIINLGFSVNQNTPYTIMVSLTLKDILRVYFVEPITEQTIYYPAYILIPMRNTIGIQKSHSLNKNAFYPSVLNNKQIMIWINFNPSTNQYKLIIGNGNFIKIISSPISNFSTNKMRIDANHNIINKICYKNQHFASAETFTKMMFEERKNGSYF